MVASFVTAIEHWFQTEYVPHGQPWYDGAIWGNLFVVPVALILGSIVWPPARKRLHRFVDRKIAPLREQAERHHQEHLAVLAAHTAKLEEIHEHIRKTHPLT